MKLLFLADVGIRNPASGSEQVLHQQAVGLSKDGFEVAAITRENRAPFITGIRNDRGILEGFYGFDIKKKSHIFLSLLKEPSKLFNQINKKNYLSAVVCHQPFTMFPLRIYGKLEKIPLLYVFHSPSHEEYLLSIGHKPSIVNLTHSLIRKTVEGFCVRGADQIMVLSNFMKQKVMNLYRIPDDKITVNPGGVDLDIFRPMDNRKVLKKENGFLKGKIHLLTVRNLEPRMGLDNLLKSIKLLKQRSYGVHLTIGGEGPEKESLLQMINDLDLINEVRITGFISSDKLPSYYGAADFFILPTRHLEGFGLVTPESMACGTPVLGTPVGGTNEILSHFSSEFLFMNSTSEAMAEGIQKVIENYYYDEHKYHTLRYGCRKYTENFYSWQRHVENLKSEIIKITQVK